MKIDIKEKKIIDFNNVSIEYAIKELEYYKDDRYYKQTKLYLDSDDWGEGMYLYLEYYREETDNEYKQRMDKQNELINLDIKKEEQKLEKEKKEYERLKAKFG